MEKKLSKSQEYRKAVEEIVMETRGNLLKGTKTMPIPTTKEEAFERLKNFEAQRICEAIIKNFESKVVKSHKTLEDELKPIEEFIEKADSISTAVSFNKQNDTNETRMCHEYSRLKYGYYEAPVVSYYDYFSFFDGTTNEAYGRYFLFRDWLKKEIEKLEQPRELSVLLEGLEEYRSANGNKLPPDIRRIESLVRDSHAMINYKGVSMRLFSGVLYWFLTNKKPEKWIDGQVVNGTAYIKYFGEGYLEGMEEFKGKYFVKNPDNLSDPKNYASRVIHDYLNDENGLVKIKGAYPFHLNTQIFQDYGFKSGLLASLEKFILNDYYSFFEPYLDKPEDSGLSHRQIAILERFKIECNEMPDYDWSLGWKQFPKNREIKIRELHPATKKEKQKPPRKEEVQQLLKYLDNYPKTLEYAKAYLNKP